MDEFSPDQRAAAKLKRIRRLVQGFACAAFLMLTFGPAQAASLKNSEFLKYTEGQRHWWYLGAFTSLGHVAMLEDKEKGRCVLRWLFDEGENRKSRLDATLVKYPNNSPSSIVIAMLRRDCGVFLKKE